MLWTALVVAATVMTAAPESDAGLDKAQGTWDVVLTEHSGKVAPAKANERTAVTIAGRAIRVMHSVAR